MKYFAGCREDHVGRAFEGIEGYPGTDSVRTFSRAELERLLDGRGEALSQSFFASESVGVLYVTLRAECLEDIAAETPAE